MILAERQQKVYNVFKSKSTTTILEIEKETTIDPFIIKNILREFIGNDIVSQNIDRTYRFTVKQKLKKK